MSESEIKKDYHFPPTSTDTVARAVEEVTSKIAAGSHEPTGKKHHEPPKPIDIAASPQITPKPSFDNLPSSNSSTPFTNRSGIFQGVPPVGSPKLGPGFGEIVRVSRHGTYWRNKDGLEVFSPFNDIANLRALTELSKTSQQMQSSSESGESDSVAFGAQVHAPINNNGSASPIIASTPATAAANAPKRQIHVSLPSEPFKNSVEKTASPHSASPHGSPHFGSAGSSPVGSPPHTPMSPLMRRMSVLPQMPDVEFVQVSNHPALGIQHDTD